MESERDPQEELRLLRERVTELERSTATRSDPLVQVLLENSATFLSVVTPEGRFMATGRQAAAFGSVIGRSIFEFVEPASESVVRAALDQVRTTLEPITCECGAFGENGEPGHFYHIRMSPVVASERLEAIVLVPTDITERVRLEQSLRDSNDALRLTVAATGMGFWRWDILNDVISWDARLCELFGLERAPSDYATYRAMLHPDDRVHVEAAVRHALEHGVYPTIEHRMVRADGVERWILAAATVECDARGRPIRLRGGALDITEKKALARQMERAERVQAVGQLAAGVAHNFNNLLAVIIPSLSLALEEPSDTEGLPAALTAALQARDLVKSMFSLTAEKASRPEQGALPGEVVGRTLEMCRATFPREIHWTCTVERVPGRVGVSPSNLEQILLNLLTNARDAVEGCAPERAGIAVTLQHRPASPGAESVVRLTVRDSGVGMSRETRLRVFEPFFTTKHRHRGTGLGLATVAARVREAGGSIECASQPDNGTTFIIELPLRPASGTFRPVLAAEPPRRVQGRALVVDDEDLVRAMLRRVLESAGMEVAEASSAAEARAELERQRFDVVVLDQSMPVESGLAALPSLRARSQAPILLFTGNATEVPEGIAALVQKPAQPAELMRAIHELIAPSAAGPQPRWGSR